MSFTATSSLLSLVHIELLFTEDGGDYDEDVSERYLENWQGSRASAMPQAPPTSDTPPQRDEGQWSMHFRRHACPLMRRTHCHMAL